MATSCSSFDPHEQAPSLPTVTDYCQQVWMRELGGKPNCWAWWDRRPLACWRDAHRGGLEQGLQLWQFPLFLESIHGQAQRLERAWQSNANRWQ